MARNNVSKLSNNKLASSSKFVPKNGINTDGSFLKMLDGLETKISTLDDKKCPLIQETLGRDWLAMSNEVIVKMEHFISELIVLRPIFCRTVVRSLFQKFIVHTDQSLEIEKDAFTKTESRIFPIIHRLLRGIFKAYPTIEEHGVKQMASFFPYMMRSAHVHFCYVSNLLKCIEYMPQSKLSIIHIILNKLVKIDGNIPRHEIETLHALYWETCQNVPCDIKVKQDEDGVDGDIGFSGNNMMYFAELEDMENAEENNQLVGTLDTCLQLLFDFFHKEFQTLSSSPAATTTTASSSKLPVNIKGSVSSAKVECSNGSVDVKNDEEVQNRLNNFYTSCLNILFDKEILPSFGTNHVQFIFFYITSLQPKVFPQIFLERLWKKVTSVGVSQVLRIQAMSFIAGLLTRAKFVPFKTVKRWLTRMAEWANAYMDAKVFGCHWTAINLSSHGAFYAVCQALFYIFAFRNKELLGSRKACAYTRTLNLGRLITSELNPLKACSGRLAEEFVEAANYHQISYCRTVLERNQRCIIPTISADDDEGISGSSANRITLSTMENFFPFDEYLLPRSRKWIDPAYFVYDPYLPEVKIEKLEALDENEDSIEMELSKSYTDSSPAKGFSFSYGSGKLNDTLVDYMDM